MALPSMGEGDRVSGGRGWQVEIMRHTLSCTIPAAPPLVAGATTFAPIQGALWVLDILVNLRVE